MSNGEFRAKVVGFWKKHGRHDLPWRKTHDPYKILVSEIMLQQTQVDRVVPYFERFIKKFPTVQALAKAPLSDVLKEWQGLGYNRRAKLLRECAKEIVEKHDGAIPKGRSALESLLGIGPYTAGAIRVFAFNQPEVLIETNIRAVYLHHFFPHTYKVDDRLICVYVGKTAKGQDPRTWYSALMDYGAFLKKTNLNPSRRSKHHVKQSKFEGSLRQVRGSIIRTLSEGEPLHHLYGEEGFKKALAALAREGMIEKRGTEWWLAR